MLNDSVLICLRLSRIRSRKKFVMKKTPSDHCLWLGKDPGPRNVRGHPNIGFSEDVNEPVFIMAARFIRAKSEACSRLMVAFQAGEGVHWSRCIRSKLTI